MSLASADSREWAVARTVAPCEFSPLWSGFGVVHGVSIRQPGVDVNVERPEAVERLRPAHAALRENLGLGNRSFCTAEQIHGAGVAVVASSETAFYPGVDGLVTASEEVCLGIYTADCCAVFLVDPRRRVIGLAHAGAKGTQLGVVPATLGHMRERFGCEASAVHALLGPCVRPPLYEWDFAAEIRRQLVGAGVASVLDPGVCTGAATDRYYSYRIEKGRTGRMLALLALEKQRPISV